MTRGGDDVNARLDAALGRVYRASGYEAVERATPLSTLLAHEAGECVDERGNLETVQEVRDRAFIVLMQWIFSAGIDPRVVMQRVYALAKELTPDLICRMPHEQIGLLLGETRAAGSARGKALFGGLKALAGIRSDFGPDHKSAGARARMAASARGNQNRRKRPAAAA